MTMEAAFSVTDPDEHVCDDEMILTDSLLWYNFLFGSDSDRSKDDISRCGMID